MIIKEGHYYRDSYGRVYGPMLVCTRSNDDNAEFISHGHVWSRFGEECDARYPRKLVSND